jgi:hypothetical protein
VVTNVRPINGPAAGGAMVTLSGINFGSVDGNQVTYANQVVSIGGRYCAGSYWVSTTSMRCEGPAGTGVTDVANAIVVDVAVHFGTLVGAFTYDGAPGSVSVVTDTNARNHQECGLPPIC